ncbi:MULTISPECIES: HD domain-containing phosphohydrolase [unclassified Paenibacillus]|uniref:HD-GYP domain-containing protein n=1 Tax=unclassified Paenibacillus TaxID=185978 RepID=UPI001B49AE89|nr:MULTISPECIES: HD domain-containing phosphohydrolase [unclassified Paenibacillus]MBP1156792.1 putative two-component system response regulator [Paenibacillus sp. PvP091]MBP1172469.1 putative two-component system response regulator [Paenibacillus sp. PvR098]MBP2438850.1 putative two-component system response regulator [Paenibacillus sp. PvP052]
MKNERLLYILFRLMKKELSIYEHCMRVGKLAKILASHLHYNQEQTRSLVVGCLLHDIGKIFIPTDILNKDTDATVEEWETMKRYPVLGANLAHKEGIHDLNIIEIIKFHRERWDGAGYPYGLRGEFIPNFARICSILEVFDHMLQDTPHRKGLSVQEAKQELWYQSRKQFDKNIVQVFLNIPSHDLEIYNRSSKWRNEQYG